MPDAAIEAERMAARVSLKARMTGMLVVRACWQRDRPVPQRVEAPHRQTPVHAIPSARACMSRARASHPRRNLAFAGRAATMLR